MKLSFINKEVLFLTNLMKLCHYNDGDIIYHEDSISVEFDLEKYTISITLERLKKFSETELNALTFEEFGYHSGSLKAQKSSYMTKDINFCDFFNATLEEDSPIFLEYEIVKEILKDMDNLPQTILYCLNICKLYRCR